MTLYRAQFLAGTKIGFVNCENSTSSVMKAVGGGASPTDPNNNDAITASYAVLGSGTELPADSSVNANGWKVIYAAPQNRQWSVFVLCVT